MPPPKPSEGEPIWVRKRIDAKSPEIGGDSEHLYKDRPWLVLSGEDQHQRRLFLAPPMTSARLRTRASLCVAANPPREDDYIDAQQVWTFPTERIVSGEKLSLDATAVARTRACLRRYLAFATGPRNGWLCQGRVVWMRLVPSRKQIIAGGDDLLSKDTDIAGWETIAMSLLGTRPTRPEDWRLPGVVITHDAYLPTAQAGQRPEGVYSLVTVVPLVVAPQLLTPGAPRVDGPRDGLGPYAPLTQCLLTLAYDARAADRGPGLIVEQGVDAWTIEEGTRQTILNEVHYLLGVA